MHSMGNPLKNIKKGRFYRQETQRMLSGALSYTNTKTRSYPTACNLETALSAASGNKQTAVCRSYAVVFFRVTVSEHQRGMTEHSVRFSPFQMGVYCVFRWSAVRVHMHLCCFRFAVKSAVSSCSQDQRWGLALET